MVVFFFFFFLFFFYDDEASNSWITAGMFRGDEAKALRDKFDGDFDADQQRKRARRLVVSEEQAKSAAPRPKRGSDRRPVVKSEE